MWWDSAWGILGWAGTPSGLGNAVPLLMCPLAKPLSLFGFCAEQLSNQSCLFTSKKSCLQERRRPLKGRNQTRNYCVLLASPAVPPCPWGMSHPLWDAVPHPLRCLLEHVPCSPCQAALPSVGPVTAATKYMFMNCLSSHHICLPLWRRRAEAILSYHHRVQCQAHSRVSINICWLTEWFSDFRHSCLDSCHRPGSSFTYARFTGYFTPKTEKAMAPHSSTLAWKIPWKTLQ